MQPLSNCYQKTFKSASNPHKHWISELNFYPFPPIFDTFFANVFDIFSGDLQTSKADSEHDERVASIFPLL